MALSNMFREPRREITESLTGIIVIGGYFYADWIFACWFQAIWMPKDVALRILGVLLGVLGTLVCVGFLFFTHFIGEEICDSLARRGLELRPKRRFN